MAERSAVIVGGGIGGLSLAFKIAAVFGEQIEDLFLPDEDTDPAT